MSNVNKSRHGCLTTLLVVMLLGNSASALLYIFARDLILQTMPSTSNGVLYILAIMSMFNLACVIGLFTLKKWAFWGFTLSSLVALGINLYLGLGAQSLTGLIGVALLYGTLHIGKENKGWPQLD